MFPMTFLTWAQSGGQEKIKAKMHEELSNSEANILQMVNNIELLDIPKILSSIQGLALSLVDP